MSGGGGGGSAPVDVAKQRQDAQGTGTVLGDPTGKSENRSRIRWTCCPRIPTSRSSTRAKCWPACAASTTASPAWPRSWRNPPACEAPQRTAAPWVSVHPKAPSASAAVRPKPGGHRHRVRSHSVLAADKAINAAKTGAYTDDWQQGSEDSGWFNKTFHAPTVQTCRDHRFGAERRRVRARLLGRAQGKLQLVGLVERLLRQHRVVRPGRAAEAANGPNHRLAVLGRARCRRVAWQGPQGDGRGPERHHPQVGGPHQDQPEGAVRRRR